MRKFSLFVLFMWVALLAVAVASGQSNHSVTLTWTASTDAAANPSLTYNVYRATAPCSTNPTLAKVGTSSTTGYTDSAVAPGTYCYAVTAVLNGAESVQSNTAQAVILPAAPTALSATAR